MRSIKTGILVLALLVQSSLAQSDIRMEISKIEAKIKASPPPLMKAYYEQQLSKLTAQLEISMAREEMAVPGADTVQLQKIIDSAMSRLGHEQSQSDTAAGLPEKTSGNNKVEIPAMQDHSARPTVEPAASGGKNSGISDDAQKKATSLGTIAVNSLRSEATNANAASACSLATIHVSPLLADRTAAVIRGGIRRAVEGQTDPSKILVTGSIRELVAIALAEGLAKNPNRIGVSDLYKKVQSSAEAARTDLQVAASAKAGSTTVAEKTGIPTLLGLALENGAVNRQFRGTTLTLSTSPYMIASALAQRDDPTFYKDNQFLTRFGGHASFNVADTNNALSSATRQQLSEWGVRLRLGKDRSSRSPEFQAEWEKTISPEVAKYGVLLSGTLSDLTTVGDAESEVTSLTTLLAQQLKGGAGSEDETQKVLQLAFCELQTKIIQQANTFGLSPALLKKLNLDVLSKAELSYTEGVTLANQIAMKLQSQNAFNLSYANTKNDAGQGYSSIGLVYDKRIANNFTTTVNVGSSFYHKPSSTLKQERFRDFSATGSLEFDISKWTPAFSAQGSRPVLTFAGKYTRMPENARFANMKADLGIFQAKLSLPLQGGIVLPFSITWANATELIKESEVRANFGFTFDLGTLTNILKASNK